MIELIDERILALFTKFSHWFQRLTGRTNFFLARICINLGIVALLGFSASHWFPILPFKETLPGTIAAFFMSLGALGLRFLVSKAEDQFHKDSSAKPTVVLLEAAARPASRVVILLCAPWLLLLMVAVHFEFNEGVLVFTVNSGSFPFYLGAFYYFVLVEPLPPGKSKVREWREAFQAGLQKLQPAHTPTQG